MPLHCIKFMHVQGSGMVVKIWVGGWVFGYWKGGGGKGFDEK